LQWYHIVALVVGLVLGTLFMLKILLKKIRALIAADMDRELDGKPTMMRCDWANFVGQRPSKGARIRGNGSLALTEKEFIFIMAAPRKLTKIPLGRIKDVNLPKSFAGRTVFKPMLALTYRGNEGDIEGAWVVNDVEKWAAQIRGLCGIG